MVSVGHGGALAGCFAGPSASALDGALAPFRNVHKFDPLLRLPLALGLAHALAVADARPRETMPAGGPRRERPSVGHRVALSA